jgi:chromosome segregation ATPase
MTEHRNPIDPSILQRMASSMEAIKDSWDADVHELRRIEGVNASLNAELTRLSDRCDSLIVSERDTRERNEFLVNRNAQLEAHLQRLRDATADARDALDANVLRMEIAARDTPREVASSKPAALAPATQSQAVCDGRTEQLSDAMSQLLNVSPDLSSDLNDGGPDHIPVFLSKDVSTHLPPNEFGKRHAVAAE